VTGKTRLLLLNSAAAFALALPLMGREHVARTGLAVGWPVAGIVLVAVVAAARLVVLGPGLRL